MVAGRWGGRREERSRKEVRGGAEEADKEGLERRHTWGGRRRGPGRERTLGSVAEDAERGGARRTLGGVNWVAPRPPGAPVRLVTGFPGPWLGSRQAQALSWGGASPPFPSFGRAGRSILTAGTGSSPGSSQLCACTEETPWGAS